ncbi:MAG: hypothetical protein WD894_26620 [Pirellulales bacterium]
MSAHFLAQLENLPTEYLIGGTALVGLFVLIVVVRFLRRKRRAALPPPIDLTIDLAELGGGGPPRGDVSLELYNLPVRLAGLVIAPAGRGVQLPAGIETAALADSIVPGLAQIISLHKTRLYEWPAQLSTQGFSNMLFANVRLPGDRGKGTPWSVIAGRFEADQLHVLAGVVVCADAPNSLGQFVIERPGQWLDLLRVRRQ